MPASRQRSRSPCIACAVSATIGRRAPLPRSRRADRLRWLRIRPSPASGGPSARRRICRCRRLDRRHGVAAVLHRVDRVAALLQQRRHELAVDGVVFGDEDAQRSGAALRTSPARRQTSACRRVDTSNRVDERIQQIGMLDRLGQIRRRCRSGGSARASSGAPDRRQHHDRRVARARWSRLDLPRERERRPRRASGNRRSRRGTARSAVDASWSARHRRCRRRRPPSASCASWRASLRGCGGSSRCRRRRARAGRRARPALGRAGAHASGRGDSNVAVKWNVLPRPDVALDPDAAAHQLDQPQRDRQAEARCRRTGASSSCRPA